MSVSSALSKLLEVCIRDYNAGRPTISITDFDKIANILWSVDPEAHALMFPRPRSGE